MRVALLTHDSSLRHEVPPGHPERPARVAAAVEGVRKTGFRVIRRTAPAVDRGLLLSVHEAAFVERIERFCASGGGAIDDDTYVVAGSFEAALHSAGAGPEAIGLLAAGDADVAFIVTRPPGHHAEAGRAMGFCLFNNVALGAAAMRAEGHRVAIVDWDVHHGNGTQRLLGNDPEVLYVSLHEYPGYPGTGWVEEIGSGAGEGTIVNLAMPTGSGGADYRMAFSRVVEPILSQFAPDGLLVSAGYDAHRADPLAGIRLEADDYWWMASRLAAIVRADRTVFFLEGGYDLEAVTASVTATLLGALESEPAARVGDPSASASAERIVELSVRALDSFWDLV